MGGRLPFDDGEFDLVIADYVFEHVGDEVHQTVAELLRVTKDGGWIAARTPHKWGSTGLGARIIPNRFHVALLRRLQPGRKAEDVFPTRYRMNTRRRLRSLFAGHEVTAYGHSSEPAYFGRSRLGWSMASVLGRLTPQGLAPTLMIFVRKRAGSARR